MSLQKAKAFLDHVGRDEKLRNEVREPGKKALKSVLGIAKRHGYECSATDLHNALKSHFGAAHIPAAKNDDEANCIVIAAK